MSQIFGRQDLDSLSNFKVSDMAPPDKPVALVHENDHKDLDSDFEKARKGIAEVTKFSKEAIKESIELARASDKPSAWEAVATMMKTVADINMSMVELHGKKHDIKKKITSSPDAPTNQTNIQNNFNMSTTDLLEILKEKRGM